MVLKLTTLRAFLTIVIISWLLRGVGNVFFHGTGNYFVVFSLILGVIGIIPAFIAAKKGRNFAKWWLYGWILFGLALIHSIVIKPDNKV